MCNTVYEVKEQDMWLVPDITMNKGYQVTQGPPYANELPATQTDLPGLSQA